MTLTDEYLDDTIRYTRKYGDNTAVLMQVGHFYEAYAVDNETENINGDNLYRLSNIMNIQMTRKNKTIIKNSRKNPLMIGVNIYSIDKFVQILLNNMYTIVIIDQTSQPPYVKREVTNIYSPGTNIKYYNDGDSNNLLSIYIEEIYNTKTYQTNFCCGISCIDLSTGTNFVNESFSRVDDSNYSLDEVYKFLRMNEPKEIVIIKKNVKMDDKKLFSYLYLTNKIVHVREYDECDKQFFKLDYQKQFLSRVFKNTGLLSSIEYIGLENMPFALLSYIFLLQFAYEHSENIIKDIEPPSIWERESHLSLTNNSINQLDLINNPSLNLKMKFNSLFAVINNTSTSIGRRYLKERLLNPIIDSQELDNRYSQIDLFLSLFDKEDTDKSESPYIYKYVESYLTKIIDLERVHRKMSLDLLHPADLCGLMSSYTSICDLLDLFILIRKQCKANTSGYIHSLDKIIPSIEEIEVFKEYIECINNDFNLDECVKYHIDKITGNIFNKGVFQEIDGLCDSIEDNFSRISLVNKKLSKHIDVSNTSILKLENNERDGYYFTSTTKRINTLKKALNKYDKIEFVFKSEKYSIESSTIEFKTQTKSLVKITSPYIKSLSNSLISSIEKLKHISKIKFQSIIQRYFGKYNVMLSIISRFVGNMDVIKSAAKTSILYGYTRPEIYKDDSIPSEDTYPPSSVDNRDMCSFLCAKDIRHPIIERLDVDMEYVSNDISIGLDITKTKFDSIINSDMSLEFDNKEQYHNSKGILLFGTNASGKSSLMKAIGINIILAQSGHYVACKKLVYRPFNSIFTRINNNDNIFKGESSFAVEMSELRSILKRADEHSLVLGDELCAGTESTSALSIFSSSVYMLEKRNVSFMFATHLHELCNIPRILELDRVKMFHLKVIYNKDTGILVYDRKLEPGNGPAMYGLEVCKAMNMDTEFLIVAEEIRKNLLGINHKILDTKNSRYNSNVYIHDCEICKSNAVDVHHIKFQCTADKNNIIDGSIKKDTKSNLVQLCKECHNKVHAGKVTIFGYKTTSNGNLLDFVEHNDTNISNSIGNEPGLGSLNTIYKSYQEPPDKINNADKVLPDIHSKKTYISPLGTHVSVLSGKKKKFNEEQIKLIRNIAYTHKTTKKQMCHNLQTMHTINISITTLNKIINNQY